MASCGLLTIIMKRHLSMYLLTGCQGNLKLLSQVSSSFPETLETVGFLCRKHIHAEHLLRHSSC